MLGELIWDKRSQKGGAAAISTSHEHILVFANSGFRGFNEVPKPNAEEMHVTARRLVKHHKDIAAAQREFNAWLRQNGIPIAEAAYNHIETHKDAVRLYQGTSLAWPQANRNGYRFEIVHPGTKRPCAIPDKGLMCSEATFKDWHAAGRIVYGSDETTQPRKKLYLDENMTEKVRSIFVHSKGGVTDLKELNCGLDEKFSYPKPLGLLKHLLGLLPPDVKVLDFFAGSGTTAHAVMQLNAEDGGSRRCILVTNDEGEFKDPSGKVLPGGICTHVTYPRLKKVIEGYTTPKGKVVAGLGENLEFFQTAFHPAPETRNQTQAFAAACVPMLNLKSDCFSVV
jgi:adenine-specific DNA-methyltransferase